MTRQDGIDEMFWYQISDRVSNLVGQRWLSAMTVEGLLKIELVSARQSVTH